MEGISRFASAKRAPRAIAAQRRAPRADEPLAKDLKTKQSERGPHHVIGRLITHAQYGVGERSKWHHCWPCTFWSRTGLGQVGRHKVDSEERPQRTTGPMGPYTRLGCKRAGQPPLVCCWSSSRIAARNVRECRPRGFSAHRQHRRRRRQQLPIWVSRPLERSVAARATEGSPIGDGHGDCNWGLCSLVGFVRARCAALIERPTSSVSRLVRGFLALALQSRSNSGGELLLVLPMRAPDCPGPGPARRPLNKGTKRSNNLMAKLLLRLP